MLITKKVQDAINEQINKELYSSYIYLSMSAYFDNENLKGMAKWMKKQASEEVEHAMKFYEYVYSRGGKVVLKAIDNPPETFKSPLDAFETAYKHETVVTKLIHNLVNLADKEKDHATKTFLNWFVEEQVEEEDSALEIVEKLKLVGSNKSALLMMDHQLGERK